MSYKVVNHISRDYQNKAIRVVFKINLQTIFVQPCETDCIGNKLNNYCTSADHEIAAAYSAEFEDTFPCVYVLLPMAT